MRGRLIRPFLVEIYRLDTAATAADPDGAGPLTAGYDPIFREPVVTSTADGVGSKRRVEMAPVQVHAQIETGTFQRMNPVQNGIDPSSHMTLVMHLEELEANGYVDAATGMVVFKPSDRIGAFYKLTGALVQSFPNPPGLFITEVMPSSYGLGIDRNLVIVRCEHRKQGQ